MSSISITAQCGSSVTLNTSSEVSEGNLNKEELKREVGKAVISYLNINLDELLIEKFDAVMAEAGFTATSDPATPLPPLPSMLSNHVPLAPPPVPSVITIN